MGADEVHVRLRARAGRRAATDDRLRGEVVLGHVELAVGDQAVRRRVVVGGRERVRGDVRRERTEGFEDDVLVRRPGVWRVPGYVVAVT